MALTQEEYGQIIRYLSGEMTAGEQASFGEWKKERPEREQVFREAEQIWSGSGIRMTDPGVDTDKEWEILNKSISREDGEKIIRFHVPLLARIAASVLVVFLIGYYWFSDTSGSAHTISAGESVEMFFLPDSSQIWLNANSSLSYTDVFGQEERRVTLQGEGFFKVQRDAKPFIITTRDAFVLVLGTSFNLKEGEEQVTLTVAEGTVEFKANASGHEGLIVNADETASLQPSGVPSKEKNKDAKFAHWRLKGSAAHEREVSNPVAFISPAFNWKKNAINQSVVSGALSSTAEFVTYRNIVMLVKYENAKGKPIATRFTVKGPLPPGSTFPFEKRLLDIFRDTRNMEVVVESADVDAP